MFLRCRATQAEYFDAPERTLEEVRDSYHWLGRVNRLTRFERPFRIWIPRLLGEPVCQSLRIVDLGAGDGALGRTLREWAASQGWDWRFTNVDLNPIASQLNPHGDNVTASVLDLPFEDGAFDLAIGTTMTHHLQTDAEVIQHFREAWRVARRGVVLCDMHRNPAFHAVLGVLLVGMGCPREFIADGLLSVRRGWRVAEWRRFVDEAGLCGAKVWFEHGTRVLMAALKEGKQRGADGH